MERVSTLRNGIVLTKDEPIPLVMSVVFPRGNQTIVAGGPMLVSNETKQFVCYNLLPDNIRAQIDTFIQLATKP